MATIPGDLIWEIVKKNNSFLVKQNGNSSAKVQFSRERNNLYNKHSFKFSGLANKKTVSIKVADGEKLSGIELSTTKTRKQNKPANLHHKSVMKKELFRMAKAVVNQVADNHYRPDLKNAALARLSCVHKSLRVAKAGGKKKGKSGKKVARK